MFVEDSSPPFASVEEYFAEMELFTVDGPVADDTRQALYERMEGE